MPTRWVMLQKCIIEKAIIYNHIIKCNVPIIFMAKQLHIYSYTVYSNRHVLLYGMCYFSHFTIVNRIAY